MTTSCLTAHNETTPATARKGKAQPKPKPIDHVGSVHEAISQVNPRRWDTLAEHSTTAHLRIRLDAVCRDGRRAADIVEPLAEELADLLSRHAPEIAVESFLEQDADWAGRLERLASLRCLELMAAVNGPALPFPGWRPTGEDQHLRCRVLNPVEHVNLWLTARNDAPRQGALALMDETATTGEIAATPVHAFDLNDAGTRAERVLLGGVASANGTAVEARIVELEGPGAAALARLIRDHRREGRDANSHWAVRSKHTVGAQKVADAVGMAIVPLMRTAGLKGDPTVEPMSIRNTAGRRIHDRDGIVAAAEHMGMPHRLDDVAVQIGLRPWPAVRRRKP